MDRITGFLQIIFFKNAQSTERKITILRAGGCKYPFLLNVLPACPELKNTLRTLKTVKQPEDMSLDKIGRKCLHLKNSS